MNYTTEELFTMGIVVGKGSVISRHAIIINPTKLMIGRGTRIDAFTILSVGDAGMVIGDYCHIAAGCKIFGSSGKVTIGHYVSLSTNSCHYTANDDYRDGYLSGPTIPAKYKKVKSAPLTYRDHSLVGAGTIVLPGAYFEEGACVGALSLVKGLVPSGSVGAGNPLKIIGSRDLDRLRSLEKEHRAEYD